MTTNQELRKLAEDEIDARVHGQTQYEWGRVLPTKVIELLDRIDRLEAENENKDKLLEQAQMLLDRYRLETPMGNQPHMITLAAYECSTVITQHLKGTP